MPSLLRDPPMAIPIMDSKKKTAPAVQAAGSPPKQVRFHSDRSLVTTSRQRTEREAWSFWWFETHCKECSQCIDPYAVYKRGEQLCPKGDALARDMALHVYMYDGEIYERLPKDSLQAPDRVEIPHNYRYLQGQLKAMEKIAKHEKRRSQRPIVKHDQGPGQRVDERRREDRYYKDRAREDKPKSEKKYEKPHRSERAEIIVEAPHSSERERDHKHDEKERSGRRRHTHNAEYRREHDKEKNGEKFYVREEKPDKEYRREERHNRERKYSKEQDIPVEVETKAREKKYKTEVRKPDKEHRKSYYY